jgi:hypothetical protein
MKRSAGVIVSGIIAILGSVALWVFGIFAVLAALVMRTNPDLAAQQSPMPFSLTTVLLVEAGIFGMLGAFGIAAAIGLLRLKNWARISFVVFAGILCFSCIVVVSGALMAMLFMPQIVPPDPNVPEGILTAVFVFYLVFGLLVGALSVWWLIYFTRRHVKEQFMSPIEAATPPRGPISVTIIAWLLAVGGGLSVLYIPFTFPTILFGIVFHGWMARLVLLIFGGVGLLAGVGILRWRPQAHSIAVGIYIVGLVNAISFYVIPGAFARMNEALLEMMPQPQARQVLPSDVVFRYGMLMGVLGASVCLWFLITRRKAFLEACKSPAGTFNASNTPLST